MLKMDTATEAQDAKVTTQSDEERAAGTTSLSGVARIIAELDRLNTEVEATLPRHPDITDRYGRLWEHRDGDLYRHCGIAADADMIAGAGLPSQEALDNPNRALCAICVDGRTRNV